MSRPPNQHLPVGVVALEAVAGALAWRDLARRPESQVRGNKTAWRILISIHPGNSLVYWAVGRRG